MSRSFVPHKCMCAVAAVDIRFLAVSSEEEQQRAAACMPFGTLWGHMEYNMILGCRITPEGWRMERRIQPSGQSPIIYIPPDGSRQLRSRKQVRSRAPVEICFLLGARERLAVPTRAGKAAARARAAMAPLYDTACSYKGCRACPSM